MFAAEYRDRVALIGADVLHGTLKGVPLYVHAVRQGTLRLPLGGGKVALLNVHLQPARRSRHPFRGGRPERAKTYGKKREHGLESGGSSLTKG